MSFARALIVLLSTAALLAGCGPSYPKLPALAAGEVVLAFGDSLTFGTGTTPASSYPARLEQLIGRKVVGAGVPGETSAEGLARLPRMLDEVQPRVLVLCHGGNDFLRRMGEDEAAANVRAMVRLARERQVAVVLVATPRPGFGASRVKFYGEIGREFAIPVEEDVLVDVLGNGRLKSDLVHPNAEGYARIAEAVAAVLRKAGAL